MKFVFEFVKNNLDKISRLFPRDKKVYIICMKYSLLIEIRDFEGRKSKTI